MESALSLQVYHGYILAISFDGFKGPTPFIIMVNNVSLYNVCTQLGSGQVHNSTKQAHASQPGKAVHSGTQ